MAQNALNNCGKVMSGRYNFFFSPKAFLIFKLILFQMTRLRTFSVQQRLRLIRQYRVKQQYINTLLERFSDNSPAASLIPPVLLFILRQSFSNFFLVKKIFFSFFVYPV